MEGLDFAQKRNIKRRLMENNQVGAEVRRIHVIYFLSRKGHIEHPHLIRVHHLSTNGVHLRDVKRWLAELRGKDMPESFAWSYKRRYKSSYVWQDLVDEDLITPVSDNEYVLKGSEISSNIIIAADSPGRKKYSMQQEEEESDHTSSSKQENQDHHYQEIKMEEPSTKTSSQEIEEESPTFSSEKSSTLTDDSIKLDKDHDQEKHSDDQSSKKQEIQEESDKIENIPPFHLTFSSSKKNKRANKISSDEKISTSSSTSQPTFSKSRSHSNGASHLLRNLITCGAVDTNDSAMLTIHRRKKPSSNKNLSSSVKQNDDLTDVKELQEGDKLGGSQRIFGTNLTQQRQNNGRKSFDGVRASPKNQNANAVYMPIYGPQCSQCGKPFRPEKMHAHMKSCKGMKAWAKCTTGPAISADDADKTTQQSAGFLHENIPSGYYLTH